MLGNVGKTVESIVNRLPNTLKLRGFGIAKIPLLFLVSPKVISLTKDGCEVQVPLNYVTKNHLGSMYFGALAIGADTVVGLLALETVREFPSLRIAPIFKNMDAKFLKRAETDVLFVCTAAQQIRDIVTTSERTGERVTENVGVTARSAKDPNDIFAEFTLGLSLKVSKK